MNVYHGMILTAAGLFAVQFLFQQRFYEKRGNNSGAAMDFQVGTQLVVILFLLIVNGFRLQISTFSLGVALISSLSGLLSGYVGMKAMATVNLVGYSMFAMLGGMIIPFWFGILFRQEPITVGKILCSLLITAALLLSVAGKGKMNKGVLYYFAVFFFNGMAGVYSIIHQSNLAERVDSASFSIWGAAISMVSGLLVLLLAEKRLPKVPRAAIPWMAGFALLNCIGNQFLLIALNSLPASIQYPVVTGGTMVFTALISGIRKEKLTRADLIATGIALVATIVIIL